MNKINILFGALIILFTVSCEGPEGPPGFDGRDGPQGPQGPPGEVSQVVEFDGVNFTYDGVNNIYSTLIEFGDVANLEVFEADAVLVYRFDGVIDLEDGSTADAWTQLPQNFFTPEGTLQYVFLHTFVDVELFIDGNFDLSDINTDFTDNQTFRIVVVPGEFMSSAKMDTSNINTVMGALGIGEEQVKKIEMK